MQSSELKFLTISQASKLLGIAPNTLLSWGSLGKIEEYRHPINNYRLYKTKDVQSLMALLQRPPKSSELRGYARVDS